MNAAVAIIGAAKGPTIAVVRTKLATPTETSSTCTSPLFGVPTLHPLHRHRLGLSPASNQHQRRSSGTPAPEKSYDKIPRWLIPASVVLSTADLLPIPNIKDRFNMHEISGFLLRLGYIVPEMYE